MPDPCNIVWFRQDLRLEDNPALLAAVRTGTPIVCVHVLDEKTPGKWKAGGATRWWLHYSLKALDQALEKKGQKLILTRGAGDVEILRLAELLNPGAVYWNRCYEPFAVERDAKLKRKLQKAGVEVKSFNGSLLYEPGTVCTKEGTPYKVFTAFWRAARQTGDPEPAHAAPGRIPAPSGWPESQRLDDWNLLPKKPDWAGGLRKTWTPGEEGATKRFTNFLDNLAQDYRARRDLPGVDATSALSPHLHFGEISPRTIWASAVADADFRTGRGKSIEKFLTELGWREFSYHLLYHFPDMPEVSLRADFRKFSWKPDEQLLRTWTRGETGYPLVDAGMRQLWEIGWMHNRVRMNAASLLVKHLLQPWQDGEAWFWDTLVDADLASNSASWQWVAGCGADAAPYFRIFNPVLQGERFDPDGCYIRRYVPELSKLPSSHIHRPWEAPDDLLEKAGVRLGKDYPRPVISHEKGRARALAAFGKIRAKKR